MSGFRQDPPDFASLVEWLATEPSVRDHGLWDDRHRVTYAELPELFAYLDARVARSDVACIAYECPQTVAGGLGMLYLLSRGHHVVLLPDLRMENTKEGKTPRFIPSFCSHISHGGHPEAEASPLAAFELGANPDYRPTPARNGFVGPDLYLRTSGSTSAPKAARMSHAKWLSNARACIDRWQLVASDRLSVPVPIFHSYGFGAAFLPGLLAGTSMDLLASFNILRCLEREKDFNPNVAFLTPGLCDTFVRVRKSARPYKLAVTAGDKIRPETVAAFQPRFGPLLNLYGSAEMGAVSSAAPTDPLEQLAHTAGASAGTPSSSELDAVPGGNPAVSVGRLMCRQSYGLDGYLIQEGEDWSYQDRADDSWFDTGDLAAFDAEGYLRVLGRSRLSIKRDGLLVVFADVEAKLEGAPGVERAVVFGHGESRRGQRIHAVCLATGRNTDPGAIRQHCFENLPVYAVPDEIHLVSSLPTLPNGKVDRRAVADSLSTPQTKT